VILYGKRKKKKITVLLSTFDVVNIQTTLLYIKVVCIVSIKQA